MGVSNLDSGTGSPTGQEVGSGFLDNLRDSCWLSFRGRIGREDYWMAFGAAQLLFVVTWLLQVLLTTFFGSLLQLPTDLLGRGVLLVFVILDLLLLVVCFWFLSAALVKRLHDLKMPGWLAFLCLPLFGCLLFFTPAIPFLLLGTVSGGGFLLLPSGCLLFFMPILLGCIKGTNGLTAMVATPSASSKK